MCHISYYKFYYVFYYVKKESIKSVYYCIKRRVEKKREERAKTAFFGKVLYEKKNLKSFAKRAKFALSALSSTKIFYIIKFLQK